MVLFWWDKYRYSWVGQSTLLVFYNSENIFASNGCATLWNFPQLWISVHFTKITAGQKECSPSPSMNILFNILVNIKYPMFFYCSVNKYLKPENSRNGWTTISVGTNQSMAILAISEYRHPSSGRLTSWCTTARVKHLTGPILPTLLSLAEGSVPTSPLVNR